MTGSPLRTITDAERRSRLGIRQALSEPMSNLLAATNSVVCLHATEPSSIYLSAYARSNASREAISHALYDERIIVRQLAMRRTVFAFPRDLLPAVRGSAAARVAVQQAALLARDVSAGGIAVDGVAWVEQTCATTLVMLREAPATTAQLRMRLPALQERLSPLGRRGAAPTPVAPRVLTVLAARGSIVRGMNNGGWKVSRPYWIPTETWLGSPVQTRTEAEGYAELIGRWLWAFGPGTEADIVWWLGATKSAVRRALADLGAVAVQLEDGSPAWLHPQDREEVPIVAPWVALLPTLDPTTMGWRGRGFYVDEQTAAAVYDHAGNGNPTAWWNGRIVGGWAQEEDGTVVVVPTVSLPQSAVAALRHEAKKLTAWLDGDVIRSSIQSPLMQGTHRDLIR